MSRRLTGLNALRRPAGPHAGQLRGRRGRQRRLAGHRHRGRRLVRLGRVPPGRRRALAHRRAAPARLAVRGPVRDRRRADQLGPRVDFAGKGLGGAVAPRRGDAVFSGYLDKFDTFQPAVRIDQTPGGRAVAGDRDLRARRRLRRLAHRRAGEVAGPPQGRREGLRAGVRGLQPRVRRGRRPGQIAIGVRPLRATPPSRCSRARAPARRLTVAVYDRLPGAPGGAQLDPLPRPQAADQVGRRLGELGRADVHGVRRRQGRRHDHGRTGSSPSARSARGCTATACRPPTAAARCRSAGPARSASTRACRRSSSRSAAAGAP